MAAYRLTLWGPCQSSPLAGSWYTKLGAKSSSSAKSGSPFLGGRASGPAEPVLPNVDRVGRNLPSAVASVVVDVYKVYTPRGLYPTQKEVSGS